MKCRRQVTRFGNRWIRSALLWAAVLILSGCVGLIVKPYGHVAQDHEKVRKGGKPVAVIMPETAPSISQGYNPQLSETENIKSETGHHGIDIISKTGTPVLASAPGMVLRTCKDLFYGKRITLYHGRDPSGRYFRSRYLHLEEILVKEGDTIVRGQQIGTLGRTGLLAGFPHLHYEIRVSDSMEPAAFHSVNPHTFWSKGVGRVTCFDKDLPWPDRPFQTTYPVPCLGTVWR